MVQLIMTAEYHPPDLTRQLPHAVTAETALLGSILTLDCVEAVSEVLESKHFALEEHSTLFNKAVAKAKQGQLVDLATMKTHLTAEQIGEFSNAAVTKSTAIEYAHHIKDCYLHRQLIGIGASITSDGYADVTIDDAIEGAGALLEGLSLDLPASGTLCIRDSVAESLLSVEGACRGENQGLPTGLVDFDKIIGGLRGPDLIVLAGRPAMGKTSLALGIAHSVAKKDKTVAFFSLEMSAHQLNQRLFSMTSGVDLQRIWQGDIGEPEWPELRRAAEELQGLPIHVDDHAGLTPSQIKSRAKKIQRKHGLDLIVVDYLQLSTAGERYSGQRVNEVSQLTAAFKGMAKDLGVPVILLSQLSRAVEQRENHRPILSDLRDSGSIEQDADIVGFVFREEYYVSRSKPSDMMSEAYIKWQEKMELCRGKGELIIDKNRNGPTGMVNLTWVAARTLFGSAAR